MTPSAASAPPSRCSNGVSWPATPAIEAAARIRGASVSSPGTSSSSAAPAGMSLWKPAAVAGAREPPFNRCSKGSSTLWIVRRATDPAGDSDTATPSSAGRSTSDESAPITPPWSASTRRRPAVEAYASSTRSPGSVAAARL